mgnify:CR=1 FL=1
MILHMNKNASTILVIKSTTQKKTKMLTHKQMVSKMLKKPAVKAAVKELDRTEFAILDEILAARK